MQERKRLEQAIGDEAEVARLTSDLDTLFELGREGENVTADLDREIQRFSERLEVLETGMLLNGPNDGKSAIMAIHPGAGGTEARTGRRCCCACICAGRNGTIYRRW